MRTAGIALALGLLAHPALADALDACRFDGLPPMLFIYPDGDGPVRLRIGGRPAVDVVDDRRAGGVHRAEVDGYGFAFFLVFNPPRPAVEVTRGGAPVGARATGACNPVDADAAERFLGPPDAAPLTLGAAGTVATGKEATA